MWNCNGSSASLGRRSSVLVGIRLECVRGTALKQCVAETRPGLFARGTALDRYVLVGLHNRGWVFKLQLRGKYLGKVFIPHF